MSAPELVAVSVTRSSSFNVGWAYTHRRWLLLVLASDLTDGQKVDLVTRGLHCEFKTGTNSYVSQATIAKKNGHSERQVIRSDRAAEAAGLLEMTEERKGTSNIYRLTAPVTEGSPLTEESGVPLTEESSPPDRGVRGPLTEESPKEEVKKESKKISNSSSPLRGEDLDDDESTQDLSGESATPPPGPSAARPREDRGYFLDPEVEEGYEDWMEKQIIKPLCPDLNIRAYARHCVASGYDAQDVLDMLCVCAAGNLPGFTGHMNGAMLNKCLDEMMEAHHRHEAENVAEQAEREAYEQASAEREAHAAGEAEERNAERARREQQAADEKEAERERSRQEAERQSAEREARLQEQRHERQQLIEDLAALRGVNPTRVEADLAAEHIGGIDNQSRWLRKQIKLLAGA